MTKQDESGFVYILTNPRFKEDWVKIGKSTRPVDIRSKELDNTAVPLPFEIYATMQTSKFHEVEKLVHKMIDRLTDLRIRQSREFFNVPPQVALDIFRDITQTIDDAEIIEYRDNKPLPRERGDKPLSLDGADKGGRRSRFKFDMIGVQIGEELIFTPSNLRVRVAGEDTIEYEGRIYKLSPFVGTFMPREKNVTPREPTKEQSTSPTEAKSSRIYDKSENGGANTR